MYSDTPSYGGEMSSIIEPEDRAVFTTYDDDYGLVPEPRPAGEFQPSWCDESVEAPIIDALNEGWIFRLPARVELNSETSDEGVKSKYSWDRELISRHHPGQMGDFTVPIEITKFHIYWIVHLPDGYSALITEPLSRPHRLFTPFSGCIDYDNFPTVTNTPTLLEEKTHTVLPEGTPLMQLIPFKRDEMLTTGATREATAEEQEKLANDDYERADRDETTTSVEAEQTV